MTRENSILALLLALVASALFLPFLFWGFSSPYGGPYGMMGMMGQGWGFMLLIPILSLVLIALGVYYLFSTFQGTGRSTSSRGERALDILKERYARGELTREQYLKMKEELGS